MHVLTILDHPNPNSFSAAVAQRFMAGAKTAGHTTECADLHAEGFDPVWRQSDITPDPDHPAQAALHREQNRITRADALCFVFPLYWWGMPAMTKGWMDRVFQWDWAYNQLSDPNASLLKPRPTVLLVPAGSRSDELETKGYRSALETIWFKGTFGYFGCTPRKLELLCGAKGSDDRRQTLLATSFRTGKNIGKFIQD
ncbi:NAD(P)H dehydrogenase (quinone) [Epibacterium ulvae]|uniref:NAD(P)H dehydrogenase (Quinone) n=1 Tax=Epibacterium ulvae TaxID=1156985 RepID=A0A1G5QU26_9RHOB|nr:NAD(P)H-dependent oxidoreductase [Epibacterium ulvae]SCZ65355.1 NAD(P)H dehydrogenase (quinone) [Epibacterium ulvae]